MGILCYCVVNLNYFSQIVMFPFSEPQARAQQSRYILVFRPFQYISIIVNITILVEAEKLLRVPDIHQRTTPKDRSNCTRRL